MITLKFKKDNNTQHLNIMSSDEPFNNMYKVCFWDYNKGTEKFKWIDIETFDKTFSLSYKGHELLYYDDWCMKEDIGKNDLYLMYSLDGKRCRSVSREMMSASWLDNVIGVLS